MSRPQPIRIASTNLSIGNSFRMLEGKVGIVTGASRGIGNAIAHNLASKGCSLILNFTSESSSQRTIDLASQLQQEHGIQAVAVQADMGSENGPAHLIAVAKNHFQHPKTQKFQLDIIINNAGVSGNHNIEEVEIDEFLRQYNVNVRGPLLLIKAALPYLPNDRSGRIVNLSSVSSSLGFVGQSVYGGTKAALEAMTRTWARELSERATVNAVNPGPVATDMYGGTTEAFQQRMKRFLQTTPLAVPREGIDSEEVCAAAVKDGGRAAYETEIAGVVGMLCSPEGGWSTGSVVCANGGMKFSY
ncbi:NAD(P)-binding protein [Delitschia confertaspora ATCC 74209]|uniref:NAD(P)-binding protein n=1 Tax=Delitschia confertaspora ATCC 74209 TaxID=1513339 RepID=A0A9P4JRW3_9PLEO|nr:NAD(P)-binding protein [Delitschia confertaspora ATCC 74209]